MKPVDYSRIAPTYDDLLVRRVVPLDERLARAIADRGRDPFRVLDIGCGTGTYLVTQYDAFHAAGVEWHGVDPSSAMLDRARVRGLRALEEAHRADPLRMLASESVVAEIRGQRRPRGSP